MNPSNSPFLQTLPICNLLLGTVAELSKAKNYVFIVCSNGRREVWKGASPITNLKKKLEFTFDKSIKTPGPWQI